METIGELLKFNKPTLSTHIHTTWPSVVEAIGHTGLYDYVEFVGEYGPFDLCRMLHWQTRRAASDTKGPGNARLFEPARRLLGRFEPASRRERAVGGPLPPGTALTAALCHLARMISTPALPTSKAMRSSPTTSGPS